MRVGTGQELPPALHNVDVLTTSSLRHHQRHTAEHATITPSQRYTQPVTVFTHLTTAFNVTVVCKFLRPNCAVSASVSAYTGHTLMYLGLVHVLYNLLE